MIKNTYLGFTDNLKPMQKARVETSLDKLIRYNNKVMKKKEFILVKLQEGSTPHLEENYSYYSTKIDGYTKPRNDYRLNNNNNTYNEITKTEYDFANYLIKNNFIDEENIKAYIAVEEQQLQQLENERLDKEKREQEEKAKQEQEQENFKNWLQDQAENYSDDEKISITKEIFLNEVGSFNIRQVQLLVLIDNFDNPKCKDQLKEWLSYYNKASLKTFFHITGIKLGTTDKAIQEKLNSITSKDFQGLIPYVKKEKVEQQEVQKEVFYEMIRIPEPHFEEVLGEPFKKYGFEMFIKESNGKYTISEARTGVLFVSGNSKKELMENLKSAVDRMGINNIKSQLEKLINQFGLSPRYNNVA